METAPSAPPMIDFPMLSFALGEEIDMLRSSVRQFAAAEIAPRAAEIDRAEARQARHARIEHL